MLQFPPFQQLHFDIRKRKEKKLKDFDRVRSSRGTNTIGSCLLVIVQGSPRSFPSLELQLTDIIRHVTQLTLK